MSGRGLARSGLFQTAAGLETTVSVAASAVRHVGWWLEWHTRAHSVDGCRSLSSEQRVQPSDVLPADVRAI